MFETINPRFEFPPVLVIVAVVAALFAGAVAAALGLATAL